MSPIVRQCGPKMAKCLVTGFRFYLERIILYLSHLGIFLLCHLLLDQQKITSLIRILIWKTDFLGMNQRVIMLELTRHNLVMMKMIWRIWRRSQTGRMSPHELERVSVICSATCVCHTGIIHHLWEFIQSSPFHKNNN